MFLLRVFCVYGSDTLVSVLRPVVLSPLVLGFFVLLSRRPRNDLVAFSRVLL